MSSLRTIFLATLQHFHYLYDNQFYPGMLIGWAVYAQ